MAKDISISYSEDYKSTLFLAWYRGNRPKDVGKIIVSDERGETPARDTVLSWMRKENWGYRADTLDAEVKRRVENEAIYEKVEMLKRQADYGKQLQILGFEFFVANGIEKEATALQMIKIGAELEKNTRGLPQALEKIANMDNIALSDMASKMLAEYDDDDIAQVMSSIKVIDDTEEADFVE